MTDYLAHSSRFLHRPLRAMLCQCQIANRCVSRSLASFCDSFLQGKPSRPDRLAWESLVMTCSASSLVTLRQYHPLTWLTIGYLDADSWLPMATVTAGRPSRTNSS